MPRYFVSKLGGQFFGCAIFRRANEPQSRTEFNRKSRGASPHLEPRLSFYARLSWAFVFFFRLHRGISPRKTQTVPHNRISSCLRALNLNTKAVDLRVQDFGSKIEDPTLATTRPQYDGNTACAEANRWLKQGRQ